MCSSFLCFFAKESFFCFLFSVILRTENLPYIASLQLLWNHQKNKCHHVVPDDCYHYRHRWAALCQVRVLWRTMGKGHPSQNSCVGVHHAACPPHSLQLLHPFLSALHSWECSVEEWSCTVPHSCVCSPFILCPPAYLGSKLLLWIDSLACSWLPISDKLLVVICWWRRNGYEANAELNKKFQSLKINIFLKLPSAGV